MPTSPPPKQDAAKEGEAEDEGENHQGDREGGHLVFYLGEIK